MNCEFAQTTVHAYFDGELDALRSIDFEDHLEICAECNSELTEISALSRQLHEGALFQPASAQLLNRVRKQIARQTARPTEDSRAIVFKARRPWLGAAFGALAAAACLLTAFFVFQPHSQSNQITAELVDAHVRSLQPGHLTDVLSTSEHTVKPWFDGKLDFIPPVSDFSAQGFPLVGGRMDVIDGHDVAVLVYSRDKHVINVFVWPYREKETTVANSGSHGGYNWVRWQSGEMELCLISDASPTDISELRDLIRQE
jgi:anti-sigma factor RsiW